MNFYELLEVRNDASEEVIKMAYKGLCRKYHPDTYKGDQNFANEFMSKLNEAYSVLSDPQRRAIYDMTIAAEEENVKRKQSKPGREKSKKATSQSENKMSSDELGMNWFSFYAKFSMVLSCLGGIREIIASLLDADIRTLLFSGNCVSVIIWIAFAIDLAFVIIYGYLWIALQEFTEHSYKLNKLLLVFLPSLTMLSNMDFSLPLDEQETATFITYFVLSSIYSILNLIYFHKRSFLFDGIEDNLNLRNFSKSLIALVLAALFSAFFIAPGVDSLLTIGVESANYATLEDDETDISVIWENFNKLSDLCGYESTQEMVNYIQADSGVELNKLTVKERYQYIATEYMGLSSYDEAVGATDPYSGNLIENFNDYQQYVYSAFKEYLEEE